MYAQNKTFLIPQQLGVDYQQQFINSTITGPPPPSVGEQVKTEQVNYMNNQNQQRSTINNNEQQMFGGSFNNQFNQPTSQSSSGYSNEENVECWSPTMTRRESNHSNSKHQPMIFRDELRKKQHNDIEKRRRGNINDKIQQLAGMLPESQNPQFKQHKGNILSKVVDYIKQLEAFPDQIQQLQMENTKLLNQNAQLQQKIVAMAQVMGANGVQYRHVTNYPYQ